MRRVGVVLMTLAAGCAARDGGIEVEVQARVEHPVGADLVVAAVALEQVALVPCVEASRWRWLSPISTAWAHGGHGESPTGPLVVAAPMLVDLRTAEPQALAVLRPPPGRYCGLRLGFAPSSTDGAVAGSSLLMAGGGQPLRSARTASRVLSFEPRVFDAEHLDGRLVVRLTPTLAATGDASFFALVESSGLE